MKLAYERALEMALRENQATLFDLDGTERVLDRQSHVESYVSGFDRRSSDIWKNIVLQLTIDIWASWEVHIALSSYGRDHFGAVHMAESWLLRTSESPPCAILSNHDIHEPDEIPSVFPGQFEWRAAAVLGQPWCAAFRVANGIYYRLYLGHAPS